MLKSNDCKGRSLELELQSLRTQMVNVENADAGFKRHFDEKSRNLQDALMRIQILEKNVKSKDIEIAKCKAHTVELTLHEKHKLVSTNTSLRNWKQWLNNLNQKMRRYPQPISWRKMLSKEGILLPLSKQRVRVPLLNQGVLVPSSSALAWGLQINLYLRRMRSLLRKGNALMSLKP